MDDNEKKVTLNISTLQASEKKVLTPEQALEELRRQRANGMWAFIDGKETDVNLLTPEDLENVEDIELMYEIQGGQKYDGTIS